jgi:hypothetical protein
VIQLASRRLFTTETRVPSQASTRGSCGRRSVSGTVFFRVLSFFLSA